MEVTTQSSTAQPFSHLSMQEQPQQENVEYPQVIDTALLEETQDVQVTPSIPTLPNTKNILILLIVNAVASCSSLLLMISSIISKSNIFPEMYYVSVMIALVLIAFLGFVFLKRFNINKILFAISSSLALFFVVLTAYVILILLLDYSFSLFPILFNGIVFISNLLQLSCSIALTILCNKSSNNHDYNTNSIIDAKEKHAKRINISIFVIDSIAILYNICMLLFCIYLFSPAVFSWTVLVYTTAFAFFIFGNPILSIISSIYQVKQSSKIGSGITFGSNLFPLLLFLPLVLLVLLNSRNWELSFGEWNTAMMNVMSPSYPGFEGLVLVLFLLAMVIIFGIVVPSGIVACLSFAVLFIGRN